MTPPPTPRAWDKCPRDHDHDGLVLLAARDGGAYVGQRGPCPTCAAHWEDVDAVLMAHRVLSNPSPAVSQYLARVKAEREACQAIVDRQLVAGGCSAYALSVTKMISDAIRARGGKS